MLNFEPKFGPQRSREGLKYMQLNKVEITPIIDNLQTIDTRQQASEDLKKLQETMFSNVLISFSERFANPSIGVKQQGITGLVLVDILDLNKHPHLKEDWANLDMIAKDLSVAFITQIFYCYTPVLRSVASQIIVKITLLELPSKEWPYPLRAYMCRLALIPDDIKQTIIQTLCDLCDEISADDLSIDQVNFLISLAKRMMRPLEDDDLILRATKLLIIGLHFAQKKLLKIDDSIVQRFCEMTISPELKTSFRNMTKEEISSGRDDVDGDEIEIKQGIVELGFSADSLKLYYGKLFPHAEMFKWMSYGNDGKHPESYFRRREFSFTLENGKFLRFQSFNSAAALKFFIKMKCPLKIYIGPVYSVDPAKRRAYAQAGDNVFTPVERELIFDIELSDWENIGYCCSCSDLCSVCWSFMTTAIKVIDTALRDEFGFNHILWVYSGWRGVHCWVCDGKARRLTNEQRAAITDCFRIYKVLLTGASKNMNHLSMAPFCVHPVTGRVCVPIDPDRCGEFDPTTVPTLSKLLEELNRESSRDDTENEWDRTSLGKSISYFRSSFLQPLLKSCKEEME